ncbi:MAG: tetratricopeptide repeat protein [Pseudanabaena sp. CAN_BIN31]|nr:tetratricopeptide repeat protein [Pseudanabaena sp. CAN_BIN31]
MTEQSQINQTGIKDTYVGRDLKIGNFTQQNITQILQEVKQAGILLNLPTTNVTFFAGREDDLVRVHELLTQNQWVAVSAYVKGMGGVGKTELSIQYALRHVLTDYRGGVCWLQANNDIALQLQDFVRVQLDQKMPDDLDSAEKLAAYCWKCLDLYLHSGAKKDEQGKRMLVILDDVKDYEAVEPFLPPSGSNFCVLATTRLALGGSMQQYSLDVLELNAAVNLLRSFLVEGDWRREEVEIAALCERLGRLPLAVELVGRYLALPNQQDTSIADLINRLQAECMKQLARLTDEEKRLLPSNLNVVASFTLSWQELSSQAQRLACLLGLFALAPIPWQLVEDAALFEISGESVPQSQGFNRDELKALRGELLNLHLLERSDRGIFQLHQLLREYFQFQLKLHPEWLHLRQQLVGALLVIAKRIPQAPTLEKIAEVTPAIPHLEMMSREMLDDILNSKQDLSSIFEGIGIFYEGQGLYVLAEDPYERGLKATQELLGDCHLSVATSLNNLAELYLLQGRYAEAEPLFKQALALRQELLGDHHFNVATSLNNLAELYRSQRRYVEAEPLYKRALAMKQELLGDRHPEVATSLNNLALLYKSQGRYKEAEPLRLQCLEIEMKTLGEKHPQFALSLNNLAALYYSQARYEEAESLYKRALTLMQERLDRHPDVATSLYNLAVLYKSQGRYKEAEPLYIRALTLFQELLGDQHPHTIATRNNLTDLHRLQGK